MFRNNQTLDFVEENKHCAYFDDKLSDMHYRYIDKCSVEQQQVMLERGWRRFGNYFFHPICQGCNECKSLRIDANNYQYTKSQKKAIKRNKDTKIIIQKPSISKDHLDLYDKYHLFKNQKDKWRYNKITQEDYYEYFVE